MQLTFSGHPTAQARKHRVSRSPEHGQLARPGGVVRSCGATRVLGPQTVRIEGGYVAQKSEVAQSADSQYFCVQPFGFGQRDQLIRHDCYTHTHTHTIRAWKIRRKTWLTSRAVYSWLDCGVRMYARSRPVHRHASCSVSKYDFITVSAADLTGTLYGLQDFNVVDRLFW